jgi:hypothetical protein
MGRHRHPGFGENTGIFSLASLRDARWSLRRARALRGDASTRADPRGGGLWGKSRAMSRIHDETQGKVCDSRSSHSYDTRFSYGTRRRPSLRPNHRVR